MTGSLPTSPFTAGRRVAPDDVWARVQADYLSGVSGPECCRRYGVGLTALCDRAARGGWRRADQVWTPPNRLDPEDEGLALEQEVEGDLDRVEPDQLAWVAQRRMMRAAMRGDAVEALRWRRVQQVMQEEEADTQRFILEEQLRDRLRRPDEDPAENPVENPVDPVDPDASDGVSAVRIDRTDEA